MITNVLFNVLELSNKVMVNVQIFTKERNLKHKLEQKSKLEMFVETVLKFTCQLVLKMEEHIKIFVHSDVKNKISNKSENVHKNKTMDLIVLSVTEEKVL